MYFRDINRPIARKIPVRTASAVSAQPDHQAEANNTLAAPQVRRDEVTRPE